jgi:hypothetical protein
MVVAMFLTETQVAERYAIGVRQLRLMRMRGTGPKYIKSSGAIGKRGGRVIYDFRDIESWLSSRPQGGGERLDAIWPPQIEKRKALTDVR